MESDSENLGVQLRSYIVAEMAVLIEEPNLHKASAANKIQDLTAAIVFQTLVAVDSSRFGH
jgi:hypothetical protein